jgi:crossover junction endodeoxyribonuclease RuvC
MQEKLERLGTTLRMGGKTRIRNGRLIG